MTSVIVSYPLGKHFFEVKLLSSVLSILTYCVLGTLVQSAPELKVQEVFGTFTQTFSDLGIQVDLMELVQISSFVLLNLTSPYLETSTQLLGASVVVAFM